MLFLSSSAPTGWTRISSFDGRAIQISSSGGGTSGTANWSNVFDDRTNWTSALVQGDTDYHTLTPSQGPVHGHYYDVPRGSWGGQYGFQDSANSGSSGTQAVIGNSPGGGSHRHGIDETTNVGVYYNHNIKYATAIVCQKN